MAVPGREGGRDPGMLALDLAVDGLLRFSSGSGFL